MKTGTLRQRHIRLWLLMAAAFTLILSLTVAAIVLTYRFALENRYEQTLHQQLSDGLDELERADYGEEVILQLQAEGIRLLLVDADSGAVLFRDSPGVPLFLAEPPGGPDTEGNQGAPPPGVGGPPPAFQTDEVLLQELVAQTLGADDGSFFTTDSGDGNGRNLDSRFLLLCGRSGNRLFCLHLMIESTNAAISLAIRFAALVSLIAWSIGLILLHFLSRLITQPYRRMVSTAHQLAQMDFSLRCPEALSTEFNDLSQSINSMADSLETNIAALREANRQLQVELEGRIHQQKITAELLANLSHDLKTPIAIISGYAEGLREGIAGTPEKQQRYYDAILRESEQMQAIVSSILALGRMESGETPIRHETFDLADLLDEVLESFAGELERRGLCVTRAGVRPALVCTDYECVRQSLMNYIQNAISHINGGTQIEVLLEVRQENIRASIKNSSAPISEEEGKHIWEKLYRGDPSRQRHNGEMGLGLSIVKGNMERLGHPYGFYNDAAFGGVVFWLELPRPAEETEQAALPAE